MVFTGNELAWKTDVSFTHLCGWLTENLASAVIGNPRAFLGFYSKANSKAVRVSHMVDLGSKKKMVQETRKRMCDLQWPSLGCHIEHPFCHALLA